MKSIIREKKQVNQQKITFFFSLMVKAVKILKKPV